MIVFLPILIFKFDRKVDQYRGHYPLKSDVF